MKPAVFRHVSPTAIDEVLSLLSEHSSDARVLAGGQSLVPVMNFRLSCPSILIDLNRVEDLAYIRDDGDTLAIGAMTRERTIENSDLVRRFAPLLHEATTYIAHLPIRTRGPYVSLINKPWRPYSPRLSLKLAWFIWGGVASLKLLTLKIGMKLKKLQ